MIAYVAGAVAAAAAATFAGIHTMVPWSQLYGENFSGLPEGQKYLALTFDDGPNDPWTLQLLEVLARHQVSATFFMVGRYVRQRPDLARAVAAAGHVIGSHAYSHRNLIFASQRALSEELDQTAAAIEEATGQKPYLFRPPFGGRRPATLRVARQHKLYPVLWRVTCFDWKAQSAEEILKHARQQIAGGEVILLHDGGHLGLGVDRHCSVAATDQLITEYKARGFRFLTIPEMMQRRPSADVPYGAKPR